MGLCTKLFFIGPLSYFQSKVGRAENTIVRELQPVYTLNTIRDSALYVHGAREGSVNKEIL